MIRPKSNDSSRLQDVCGRCNDFCSDDQLILTDGGRDLTDGLSDVVEIYGQPVHYRRWPTSAKVSYLINRYSRSQLLRAIRHNIDSDESTDRLKKPELAAISLKMRIDL